MLMSCCNYLGTREKPNALCCRCIVVQKLVKSRRPLCRDIKLNISSKFVYEVTENNDVCAVNTDSFKRKCVMVKLQDSTFIMALPNNVEGT